jgi:hypothetical protein
VLLVQIAKSSGQQIITMHRDSDAAFNVHSSGFEQWLEAHWPQSLA